MLYSRRRLGTTMGEGRMRVRVELFGRAASQSGLTTVELEVPEGSTLREVGAALQQRCEALGWLLVGSRPARNLEYAAWDDPVAEGDEVSFIPPVSGGSPGERETVWVSVTDEPLDPLPLAAFVEGPEMGAVVTFSGIVRDHNRGRRVDHLFYDAYRPMAEREMARIAEETAGHWACRIAMQHRLGRLEIGEPSVIVAVACAHRGDAFDACRHAIDTLKERVPIWKREAWDGGEVWIEGEADRPAAVPGHP